MTDAAPTNDPLVLALIQALGKTQVDASESTRQFCSRDLSLRDASVAAAVVRISKPADVGRVLDVARAEGAPVVVRGGGMSYTGGYVPGTPRAVLLDMSHLNAVRSVAADDRYVIVEAGCTWESLHGALAGTGLRTVLKGPISGSVSTVGGALSQNLPGTMEGVLGVEVVLPGTEPLWTGAGGSRGRAPFYRNFGPDLTGLFLGDAGALGVKTAAALQLEAVPSGVAHGSYGFETMAELAEAMVRIARLDLGGRVFGLDPLKNKTATKVGVKEGVGTLRQVVSKGGLRRGVKDAAKIALAGQRAYDDVEWSLHLTFEGASQTAAEDKLERAQRECASRGEAIDASIPIAMYARPFSIRGFLGLRGERWVPLHGIFPLSKAPKVVAETQTFFAERSSVLDENGIQHSFMLAANGPYFLIEPMFYWPDALLDLHRETLEERKLAKLEAFADNPAARTYVANARDALRDLFYELGCVTTQVGRYYPYYESLESGTASLIDRLKGALDPEGVLNPGAKTIARD